MQVPGVYKIRHVGQTTLAYTAVRKNDHCTWCICCSQDIQIINYVECAYCTCICCDSCIQLFVKKTWEVHDFLCCTTTECCILSTRLKGPVKLGMCKLSGLFGVVQLFGLFLAAGSLIHCGKDGM